MRGNRSATPDLWRVDFWMPSKAISKTCSGLTARTGPKRSVVFLRTQRVISVNSASVRPE
jgi:hypothetical protein